MEELILSVPSNTSLEQIVHTSEDSGNLADCVESGLSPVEKKFLDFVAVGNKEEIRNLLQQKDEFDVNCCDYRGEKALEIAIHNKDNSFVKFLLDEIKFDCIHYYCGILRAVLDDNLPILITLLDWCENDEKLHASLQSLISGGEMYLQYLEEVVASYLTPLMAAAIQGNMDIARELLQRDYTIEKPHPPKCHCTEYCAIRTVEGETLTKSVHRINTYRAISSPTYLLLTSDDPILTAFELTLELKCLAKELPENGEEYRNMADQCSSFATDLLDQCRTSEEVKIILQQKKGFPDMGQHRFRRLKLAIREEQKKFVAHSSCQQVLGSLLMEDIPHWNGYTASMKVRYCLKHSLLTVPVCTSYIFLPQVSLVSLLKVPFNRFIYFTTSYVMFLFLLVFTLISERFKGTSKGSFRSAIVTEVIVTMWVIGFALDLFFQYRCATTSKDPLSWLRKNILDMLMVLLFFISQVITMLRILRDVETPGSEIHGVWNWLVTIGYALYATASVIAFSRLLHWCHISADLGPLIVSLIYMIGDILRFFVIFFIVIFSFAIGLTSIYKDSAKDAHQFSTLQSTTHNLFWAIFGKGEPGYTSLTEAKNNGTTLFFEMTGYALWGIYHWVTTLVLLNMLIGMMAESYQRVLKLLVVLIRRYLHSQDNLSAAQS